MGIKMRAYKENWSRENYKHKVGIQVTLSVFTHIKKHKTFYRITMSYLRQINKKNLPTQKLLYSVDP